MLIHTLIQYLAALAAGRTNSARSSSRAGRSVVFRTAQARRRRAAGASPRRGDGRTGGRGRDRPLRFRDPPRRGAWLGVPPGGLRGDETRSQCDHRLRLRAATRVGIPRARTGCRETSAAATREGGRGRQDGFHGAARVDFGEDESRSFGAGAALWQAAEEHRCLPLRRPRAAPPRRPVHLDRRDRRPAGRRRPSPSDSGATPGRSRPKTNTSNFRRRRNSRPLRPNPNNPNK